VLSSDRFTKAGDARRKLIFEEKTKLLSLKIIEHVFVDIVILLIGLHERKNGMHSLPCSLKKDSFLCCRSFRK